MDRLLENAIDSIRLGVEDYKTREALRTLSAVRNLHAGLLLLAKWVLVQSVPKASEDGVIAVAYRPKPDGQGGVVYVPQSKRTIGLQDIERRFKDFGLNLTKDTRRRLGSLAEVRNAIEHRHTETADASLRQTLSEALPVAAEFFRLGQVDPVAHLGDEWIEMLNVKEVYDREIDACRRTFDNVAWKFQVSDDANAECPSCHSELVEQIDPDNEVQDQAEATCRSCGEAMDAETVVESLVKSTYWALDQMSVMDGGERRLHTCPSCALETYVNEFDENGEATGCVICEFKLGTCDVCGNDLRPDDLCIDSVDTCNYCGYQWEKIMERD